MSSPDDDVIDGETVPREQPVQQQHTPGTAVTEYRESGVPANPFDVDPQAFSRQIAQRGENYQHLVGWLVDNMVDGEDVVQVHTVRRSNCQHGGPYGGCTPSLEPGHWSDPDLSKRGAEKICGLLGLGTRFLGMQDFRRAALRGISIQDVIIDCEIYSAGGTAVSQGTGACSLSEVNDSLNAALKKAAKRAHVDAVKRCAGLSGLATEIKRRMRAPDASQAASRASAQAARAQRATAGTGQRDGAGRYATGADLTHCPMGKHKGRPWHEIPAQYLQWILSEMADKPDIVKAAARELERRRDEQGQAKTNRPAPPPQEQDFDDEIPF